MLLPLRSESRHAKPKLKGVFEGATVVPGPHWNNAESRHGRHDRTTRIIILSHIERNGIPSALYSIHKIGVIVTLYLDRFSQL